MVRYNQRPAILQLVPRPAQVQRRRHSTVSRLHLATRTVCSSMCTPQSTRRSSPSSFGSVSPQTENSAVVSSRIYHVDGGGYGLFSATGLNPSEFMTTNDNAFISVIIQYRLGAFGFLSSDDVKANGTLNAGLLDVYFALQWVQAHIGKFGGDPRRVTIAERVQSCTRRWHMAVQRSHHSFKM
jgi:hypothetical protein